MVWTVYKYPIPIEDYFTIEMPAHAYLLSVQGQEGLNGGQLWAWVDTDQPLKARNFFLRGTGHVAPTPAQAIYVGTFQMYHGSLVFHLFEAI